MIQYYWWDTCTGNFPLAMYTTSDVSDRCNEFLHKYYNSYEEAVAGAEQFAYKHKITSCYWKLQTYFILGE